MTEPPQDAAAPSGRVVCPSCGSEQDAPGGQAPQPCAICGKPLLEAAPAPPPARSESGAALAQPESGLAAAAEVFSKQQPRSGPHPEVDALLSVDKRLTSILALVPLWGLWRLSQSDQHTSQEKSLLGAASLGLAILLALGVWAIVPSAEERADAVRAQVRQRIQVLAGLVEEYRKEHGALPDQAAWRHSAAGGDLRFYDPWGQIYGYAPSRNGFTISTYGRDGVPGGRREDTDVSVEFADAPPPAAAVPRTPETTPIAPAPASG